MSAPLRLLWSALALLGAALTMLAASVTWPVPGAGLQPGPAAVRIAEGDPVEWAFAAERPGLSGLRVWLAQPAPAEGALAVAIADAALPAIPLVLAEAPLSAADPDGALDLAFDPLRATSSPHVPTPTLQVRLTAEGLGPGAGLALRGASGQAGAGQSVAFAPRYQARPFDALLPISAMAAGRPGLLGWPPFYALLAYAFLVALLRALWLVRRLNGAEAASSLL